MEEEDILEINEIIEEYCNTNEYKSLSTEDKERVKEFIELAFSYNNTNYGIY